MMEYSCTRSKNSKYLLVKNLLQFSIGIACYWFLGYGFAFGNTKSQFIGENRFGGQTWLEDNTNSGQKFGYVATVGCFIVFIVNGAIAEKTQYSAYLILTFCIAIFTWPAVVAWTYGGGWLSTAMQEAMIEKGSVVVYTFAGAFAVVGAVVTGRRPGRFGEKQPKYAFHDHSVYVLGAFLTILGLVGVAFFFGHDPSGGLFLANLWICGATASVTALKVLTFMNTQLDRHYVAIYQGFMAGMVFITSSSFFINPWEAALYGIAVGALFAAGVFTFNWLKLDDPLYMGPTFLLPGVFGGWLPGFNDNRLGVYWGGSMDGLTLGANIVGTVTILCWALFWAILVFVGLKLTGYLHLPDVLIAKGMDKRCEITSSGYHAVSKHRKN
jgi:ammonium transporter, Amt family